ncbi:SLATT domain-containing protein [Vibrio cholerae]|uniref:SLATT domain-containing protein n=1 Tax=Vibrio cholerae TaxID=666 RepID=UPI0015E093EB|nr:SLATT domain-containing protein [Vibrio cholerae]EJK2100760.1 SLATT domain-containing protein [Vibrio cholerae]EJL6957179.1 SLATT domain-containing protein [Vibrio cholerae]EKF9136120.1 SLATT domain-containing protein [Vibrio cholerae]EKF9607633.1 SLATT domain-containing protein [Vibrio cholerae]
MVTVVVFEFSVMRCQPLRRALSVFEIEEKLETYKYLYKRVSVTSKARYEASRRLRSQSWFSQWTLAYMAIGQIILSMLPNFDLTTKSIPPNAQNAVAVFFAVVVLAYSLLLGMGDFSARSAKIHQCGLELAELARELKFMVDSGALVNKDEYLGYVERYYQCLGRYENHSSHDYLVAKQEHKNEVANEEGKHVPWHINWFWTGKIFLYRIWHFCHYPISMLVITVWVYMVCEL